MFSQNLFLIKKLGSLNLAKHIHKKLRVPRSPFSCKVTNIEEDQLEAFRSSSSKYGNKQTFEDGNKKASGSTEQGTANCRSIDIQGGKYEKRQKRMLKNQSIKNIHQRINTPVSLRNSSFLRHLHQRVKLPLPSRKLASRKRFRDNGTQLSHNITSKKNYHRMNRTPHSRPIETKNAYKKLKYPQTVLRKNGKLSLPSNKALRSEKKNLQKIMKNERSQDNLVYLKCGPSPRLVYSLHTTCDNSQEPRLSDRNNLEENYENCGEDIVCTHFNAEMPNASRLNNDETNQENNDLCTDPFTKFFHKKLKSFADARRLAYAARMQCESTENIPIKNLALSDFNSKPVDLKLNQYRASKGENQLVPSSFYNRKELFFIKNKHKRFKVNEEIKRNLSQDDRTPRDMNSNYEENQGKSSKNLDETEDAEYYESNDQNRKYVQNHSDYSQESNIVHKPQPSIPYAPFKCYVREEKRQNLPRTKFAFKLPTLDENKQSKKFKFVPLYYKHNPERRKQEYQLKKAGFSSDSYNTFKATKYNEENYEEKEEVEVPQFQNFQEAQKYFSKLDNKKKLTPLQISLLNSINHYEKIIKMHRYQIQRQKENLDGTLNMLKKTQEEEYED